MTASTRAPGYDLFKLIVAIVLLVIFLLLLWMRPSVQPQAAASISTSTPLPSSPTPFDQTQGKAAAPTQTFLPPTTTPIPTETSLPAPTNTPIPTVTETSIPSPTIQPTDEPLPTPIVEIPSEPEVCAAISRSQLQVGMKAIIQRRLNFRSSPGIFNNLILTNIPGTEVEVTGGPACTRYENGGAYLWWEIKLPNGLTGWSAEASAFGTFYFMEPAQ